VSEEPQLVVATSGGLVRGAVKRGVRVWRGIPFAAAPTGERRFRAPEPAPPWRDERDATRFGPVAVQARDPSSAMLSGLSEKTQIDEDCLNLNVTAPADDGELRPVIVWIHGGAFIFGAGSMPLYDATSFAAEHGLVVVTINYRLGVLGFLFLGDLAPGYEAGNVGLLDQVAALRWVKENIAGFGGDPDRVTVMGESAGAVSIAHLLAMPAARGLFQRAILESGAQPLSPTTRDDATAIARRFLDELGTDVAGLARTPADRLLAVQDGLVRAKGLQAFFPSIDGVTVPRPPIELAREGADVDVPLLMGSNKDEWNLFELFLGELGVAPVDRALRARLGDTAHDAMIAAYAEARADRSTARARVDLIGDGVFRIPMIRLAEARADRAPVWFYRFDFASTNFGGRLGAAHALELPFVWNVLDNPVAPMLLGPDAVEPGRALAAAIHGAWAAFVRGDEPAALGLPAWPRYDASRRATMLLDRITTVEDDPGGAVRALWQVA
jgi:para-nitrobenzyl esterase